MHGAINNEIRYGKMNESVGPLEQTLIIESKAINALASVYLRFVSEPTGDSPNLDPSDIEPKSR